jgi:hypothetical protein
MNKKVTLGILNMNSYDSNGIPQSCLDPNGIAKHVNRNHKVFNTLDQTSDSSTIQNTSSQVLPIKGIRTSIVSQLVK